MGEGEGKEEGWEGGLLDLVLLFGPEVPVQVAACQADPFAEAAGNVAHGREGEIGALVDYLSQEGHGSVSRSPATQYGEEVAGRKSSSQATTVSFGLFSNVWSCAPEVISGYVDIVTRLFFFFVFYLCC